MEVVNGYKLGDITEMPTYTVSSTWQKPDNWFSQPDGAYNVTLIGIGASDEDGNFIPGATYEHTGMYGLKVKQSWRFRLDNGEIIDQGVAIPKEGRLSQSSTFFGYASALVGSKPGVGQSFDSEALIGLRALAFIQRDENERPRIQSLGVLREAPAAAPVAAPAAPPPPAPAPAPVAAAPEPVAAVPDLPWK
jgi:hypothetical protein